MKSGADAASDPHQCNPCCLAQDHREYFAGQGAESHPNTDLAPPLCNGICHHAVDAHGGKHQREHAERRGQRRDDPLLLHRSVNLLLLGTDLLQRQIRIDRLHRLAQRWSDGRNWHPFNVRLCSHWEYLDDAWKVQRTAEPPNLR